MSNSNSLVGVALFTLVCTSSGTGCNRSDPEERAASNNAPSVAAAGEACGAEARCAEGLECLDAKCWDVAGAPTMEVVCAHLAPILRPEDPAVYLEHLCDADVGSVREEYPPQGWVEMSQCWMSAKSRDDAGCDSVRQQYAVADKRVRARINIAIGGMSSDPEMRQLIETVKADAARKAIEAGRTPDLLCPPYARMEVAARLAEWAKDGGADPRSPEELAAGEEKECRASFGYLQIKTKARKALDCAQTHGSEAKLAEYLACRDGAPPSE